MKPAEININKYQIILSKFKQISKEKQDLENRRYKTEGKIRKLKWRWDKELREQKETHKKAQREFSSKIDIIHKNMTSGSKNVYHNIMYNLNPKGDDVIAGKRFEKELSKFEDIQKTKIRTLMVARNNYIRITKIQPKKINRKYDNQIYIETKKSKKLTESIWDLRKKVNPYTDVIRITDRNRNRIKGLKKKIREINKKYSKLEKIKPVWKGMRQADDYYDEKEKIQDKFIILDLKKEKVEQEIIKLARETNKELFNIKL